MFLIYFYHVACSFLCLHLVHLISGRSNHYLFTSLAASIFFFLSTKGLWLQGQSRSLRPHLCGQDSNKSRKMQLKSKSNQHQQSNILQFLSVYSVLFRIYCFNCVASGTEELSSQLEACRNRRIWDKWQCIPCWFVYLGKGGIWKKQQCCLSKQTFWEVFL